MSHTQGIPLNAFLWSGHCQKPSQARAEPPLMSFNPIPLDSGDLPPPYTRCLSYGQTSCCSSPHDGYSCQENLSTLELYHNYISTHFYYHSSLSFHTCKRFRKMLPWKFVGTKCHVSHRSYHSQYPVVLTYPVTSQQLELTPFVVMRAHTSAYRNWKSHIARSQVQGSIVNMKWKSTYYIEDMKLRWQQYRRNQIKQYTARIQNRDWTIRSITFKGYPDHSTLQQWFLHAMIH